MDPIIARKPPLVTQSRFTADHVSIRDHVIREYKGYGVFVFRTLREIQICSVRC